MNRFWIRAAALYLIVSGLLLFPSPLPAAPVLQILLADTGRILWEIPLPHPHLFILSHKNSIYDQGVEEAHQVDEQGRIWLEGVRTGSPAVLEYYGLEQVSQDWIPLWRLLGRVSLITTPSGETRLLVGPEMIPLSQKLPEGTRVEIRAVP